jgi:energy-coupling factor transport system permease protein
MFHVGAWVVWLLAAAVPAFMLRNPLYLVLVLGAAWLVYVTAGRTSSIGSSWGAFVKIGLFFFVLAIPFNALSIHVGRIILFRLPESWPIVGGPITLEAFIAGVVSGLMLFTIVVVFAAFNSAVDHYELLRATPPFLFQAGVVISIAITFVPQMVLSAQEIRDAQRIRGHRFRGLRDLLPLVIPLLASGLERAIQLAETMEARGFGGAVVPSSSRRTILTQFGLLAALLGLLGGLFVVTYYPALRYGGWLLVLLSGVGLATIFVLQGTRVRRTRFRHSAWRGRDVIVVLTSAAVLVGVLAARVVMPDALVYVPYPPSPLLPPFSPLLGAVLLLLAVPALLVPREAGSNRWRVESPAQNREPMP